MYLRFVKNRKTVKSDISDDVIRTNFKLFFFLFKSSLGFSNPEDQIFEKRLLKMDKLLKINLNGNLCEHLFFFVIVLVYFLHSPVKN